MQHLEKGILSMIFRLSLACLVLVSVRAADTLKPTFVVTSPKANARLTNATLVVTGTARDNVRVADVSVQVNGGTFIPVLSANGFTNWTAAVELTAGPNGIRVFATDANGNKSATNQITLTYVINAPLAISIEGLGTISPNISTQRLEIGKTYAVTAMPGKGYVFKGWSGSTNSLPARLSFAMRSNLTFHARFVDNTKPTIKLISPAKTFRTTAPSIALAGTASDNGPMQGVYFRVRGGAWQPVATENNWTNWNATVPLEPGPNLIEAYAIDAATNSSLIVSSTVTYVVCSSLQLSITGPGTVTGATNNQCLEIGKSSTLTATARTGGAFVRWTGATNTTVARLTFTMRAGFNVTAEFRDSAKPTLVVKSPLNNAIVGTNKLTVIGTAADNSGNVTVSARVNAGSWSSVNGTTNWNFSTRLEPGPNVIEIVAEDGAHNKTTNRTTIQWTKKILDTYWPMKLNDFAYFTNHTAIYLSDDVRATSDGSPGFVLVENSGAASLVRYSPDRKKMQWQGLVSGDVLIAFTPNITIVDENLLITGGTRTESGQAGVREGQGPIVTLQINNAITVTKVGKMQTAFGAFYNVRLIDSIIEFIGPGGRSSSAMSYFLAPWAGRIQQGLREGESINWFYVRDAVVNGFDINLFGESDGLALMPAEIETGAYSLHPSSHVLPTLGGALKAAFGAPTSVETRAAGADTNPALSIEFAPDGMVIAWTARGCVLEVSSDFLTWSESEDETTLTEEGFAAIITPSSEAKYFRLRRQ